MVPSGFAAPQVPDGAGTKIESLNLCSALLVDSFELMRHFFIDVRTSSESSDDGAALLDGASCKAGGLEVGARRAAKT